MQIRYLDAPRFRRAVIAGANSVIRRQRHLDDINVFPVPDSDTGTNMAATLQSVAERARHAGTTALGELSAIVADAALMGARGNSGAILAQFFQGLAEGLGGRRRVTTDDFARAAATAARWAEEAISAPREGTILTVIRDWSAAVRACGERTRDFSELLRDSLHHARASLARTPDQLRLLKEAGVVDAGAQGFVYLIEGVVHFIERGRIDPQMDVDVPSDLSGAAHVDAAPEAIRYRYCTECVLAGDDLDPAGLRAVAERFGDSVVVAGSRRKVRVHVHTDDPRAAFDTLAAYGTLVEEKVDDMRQQHVDAFGATRAAVAVVTDTGCDLPDELIERHNIHRVPLRIHFGEDQYIDRVTITPAEFYRKLTSESIHPKTSQPAPSDFKRTYERVARHYESAVSLHVPGRLSGTLQSARTVARGVSGRIAVVDAKTLSVGLGLVVLEAARAAEEGLPLEAVRARAEEAARRLRLFFSLETTLFVERGGRMTRLQGILARLVRLKPVLTFDDEGRLKVLDKAVFGGSARQKVMAHVRREAAGRTDLRFAVAHAAAPEAAEWYAREIRRHLDPAELIVTEVSPALGVHGGPGAAGVAFL